MKRILILQGPNLNLVGRREPAIYGDRSLDQWLNEQLSVWRDMDVEVTLLQSNHEGDLIDALHAHGFSGDGIVFNPGGYTHTSVALRDAIAGISVPVVEVHLTNIHAREEFRQTSLISGVCAGVVSGIGFGGYDAAVRFLASR